MTAEDAIKYLEASAGAIERGHVPQADESRKMLADGLRKAADIIRAARREERKSAAQLCETVSLLRTVEAEKQLCKDLAAAIRGLGD